MKIELTDEQVKAWENGEDIVIASPKKNHEVEYENGCWLLSTHKIISQLHGEDVDFKTHGRYRKIKSNAEFSLKRNKKSNRLEAKVEELQGDLGVGDYSLNCDRYNHYEAISRITYLPFIGEIRMLQETAIEICRLLNEGLWSMDDIL